MGVPRTISLGLSRTEPDCDSCEIRTEEGEVSYHVSLLTYDKFYLY